MRVVAGEARGRRLVTPTGHDVRPTTDRVREAIFNALTSQGAIDGARVLDLFAGSGALGIEALSRGAASATFVERDARARRAIETNLRATGLADRAVVVSQAAERFLAQAEFPVPEFPVPDPPMADSPDPDPPVPDPPVPDPLASDGLAPDPLVSGQPAISRLPFDVALLDPPYAYDGWSALLDRVPAELVVIETDRALDLGRRWQVVRTKWYGSTLVVIARTALFSASSGGTALPADGR